MAVNGDIAGVSDEWIVVTPEFARVHREGLTAPPKPGEETIRTV